MKNFDKFDKDRLLDLLEETRHKCNAEKRKLGHNKFKHHLISKWRNAHPRGFYSEDEHGMIVGRIAGDDELDEILEELLDTYRDPDEERGRLLNKIIDSFENKISNSNYKIKQLKDTANIIVDKIAEIDRSKRNNGSDDDD